MKPHPPVELPLDRRSEVIGKLMGNVQVDAKTGCWNWMGGTSGSGRGGGYGRICISGHTAATHIVSYTHFYGYIPSKKQIDHLCKNRLCCNPTHLEMVTHKQNQRRKRKS